RYSIIGLPCRTLLRVFGNRVEVLVDGAVVEQAEVADPLDYVEAFQQRYRSAPDAGLPVFHGGLVGYF
ncbi:MAG TPA: anthranilate synthase component I, partial [Haliea salexigens]|nr:anthranilate synthase component I [Haliea salexigens]